MGVTKIEWTATPRQDGAFTPGYTFNPFRGCTKISEGCANCYAETTSHRNPGTLGVWGPSGTRVVAAESAWKEPLKWDRAAKEAGERHRVFCASLADVFEDWTGPMEDARGVQWWKRGNGDWTTSDHYPDTVAITMQNVRDRLFALIHCTPSLDWLLLTKRPENIMRFAGCDFCQGPWKPPHGDTQRCVCGGVRGFPSNVWLGVSVENRDYLWRVEQLLSIPAVVHFVSAEPLLGPVDFSHYLYPWSNGARVDWLIAGGESGPGARPCDVAWIRSLVQQCKTARVACFVKQLGARAYGPDIHSAILRDKKGGNPLEWPEDLRVRQFPEVSHAADHA